MSWQEKYEEMIYLFQSEDYTRRFLCDIYQQKNFIEATEKSYENYAVFGQHIKQGIEYLSTLSNIPISIKPTLLYYGMIHFLKACMLVEDPYYPRNTQVLAHGMTTRRKKKKQYEFFYDEIKIQSTGLFPLVSEKMFHVKLCVHEKYSLLCLFYHLAELTFLFRELRNETIAIPANTIDSFTLSMPKHAYKEYVKMTPSYHDGRITNCQDTILISFSKPISPFVSFPFAYTVTNDVYLLTNQPKEPLIHEILVHYALLYYLSMLSRYDANCWLHLLQPANDEYLFLLKYLDIASQKIPLFTFEYLLQKAEGVWA